jgi:osmotically-inducible protein OsmY
LRGKPPSRRSRKPPAWPVPRRGSQEPSLERGRHRQGSGIQHRWNGQDQASSAAETVKDQATSAAETVKDQASSSTGGGTEAASQQAGNHQPDNPNPDDNTIRDRVETELFRRAWVPKGNLNIDVVDGVVELRGQLKHQADIDTLIKDARAVQHVKDVRSFLHLPGTPAPNKESAIEAS